MICLQPCLFKYFISAFKEIRAFELGPVNDREQNIGRLEFNLYPDSFKISGTQIFSVYDLEVTFAINQAAPTFTFLSVLSEHHHVINV